MLWLLCPTTTDLVLAVCAVLDCGNCVESACCRVGLYEGSNVGVWDATIVVVDQWWVGVDACRGCRLYRSAGIE